MSKKKDTPEADVPAIRHVTRKETTEFLKCELTEEEMLEQGSKLADAHGELDTIMADLEEFKGTHKGLKAKQEGIIQACSTLLRARYERRHVDCEEIHDYDEGIVTVIRKDTESEVSNRRMRDEERQMGLDLDGTGVEMRKEIPVDDEEIAKAMEIFRETGRATLTSLQRRMKLGFAKAARIMDVLEETGRIGPSNGTEPREILDRKEDSTEEDSDPAPPQEPLPFPTAGPDDSHEE